MKKPLFSRRVCHAQGILGFFKSRLLWLCDTICLQALHGSLVPLDLSRSRSVPLSCFRGLLVPITKAGIDEQWPGPLLSRGLPCGGGEDTCDVGTLSRLEVDAPWATLSLSGC